MTTFPRSTLSSAAALTLGLLLMAGAGFAEDAVLDLAGIYDIEGQTVVGETGDRFHMSGKMVVKQYGDRLTTVFEASVKRVEGKGGPATLKFTSRGDAILKGSSIAGVSEVQTVLGQVPELDVSAPMVPRRVLPPFNATSAGTVDEDGKIRFTITSETDVFGPGRDRKTTIEAVRVARKATELKVKK